ncbi:unnamed protein product [Dracunculus medinensis]|uniref:Eukaryotic translation initiation factor 3 30 kDa subunit n=1 Tax=Dracunculus medinensis TaxID=318479 RepID=A0A0N4UES7_DRAME|nr:unnamed protein product [Dracunculus medinensis]
MLENEINWKNNHSFQQLNFGEQSIKKMGDWDDEDFEVNVEALDERRIDVFSENEEEISEKLKKLETSKPQVKEKEKAVKGFSEVVSRDLTEREQIEIQRQSDFRLAKDLFDSKQMKSKDEDDNLLYSEIDTLEEFRNFGENLGKLLIIRSKATNYHEMLISLLKVIVRNSMCLQLCSFVDASKVRQLSNFLKTMADEQTAAEKANKGKNASASKPSIKVAQKSTGKSNKKDLYDDYIADEYDDIADDFINLYQKYFKDIAQLKLGLIELLRRYESRFYVKFMYMKKSTSEGKSVFKLAIALFHNLFPSKPTNPVSLP